VLGDGRRFAVGVGAGVDAAMLAGAPLPLRQRYGVGAYVVSAARELIHPQPFAVRATVDGRVIERDGCVLALVVNVGVVLNGLLHLGPNISFDDGVLDLCVYSARHFTDAAVVASRLALRRFRDDRRTAFASGRCITIETQPLVRTQADGELIGATPLSATVSPLAALLQVP
jgi:diacylglycerol kinase family enzyme